MLTWLIRNYKEFFLQWKNKSLFVQTESMFYFELYKFKPRNQNIALQLCRLIIILCEWKDKLKIRISHKWIECVYYEIVLDYIAVQWVRVCVCVCECKFCVWLTSLVYVYAIFELCSVACRCGWHTFMLVECMYSPI